jgi:hypothetical protein
MAADEIAVIVQRGRDAFDADVALRRAVERCLEIIGEASKAISPTLTAAHPEIPWSDMAKVRSTQPSLPPDRPFTALDDRDARRPSSRQSPSTYYGKRVTIQIPGSGFEHSG